ncbi:LAME_0E01376g1_1 [Lachancea meyersii CBS 8951]|uniref:LAME_0E01376g1_1 n=1 Tax=Lachancea meyersii CBS 8951 TaxID=1266667 RepID=A0A1G4JF43_9SACH|nr:LAME_0E01376g1_1 [Lachancea meyersii CBS 8951]
MQNFKKKWKELVYSFSTEDRYADYNGRTEGSDNSTRPASSVANPAASSSQIQLTDFTDGPVGGTNDGVSETMLAWRHIDAWASEHHSDLYATLSEPCTRTDISRAESDLNIVFPASVRASFRLHDGQEDLESLTGTSGLLFGLQLMSLDQVVHMTQTWRNVAANMAKHNRETSPSATSSASASGLNVEAPNKAATPQVLKSKGYGKLETQDFQGMNPTLQRDISNNYNKQFKLNSIPQQNSIPLEAVQSLYANPGWIPLVTDNAGNHIAVDLAPGPKGHYGQIILFGREFDIKYVVANNWGDFLLSFANDLERGNWYIMDGDDDYLSGAGDLVFRDKDAGNTVRDYFEVLKWRSHKAWQTQQEEKKVAAEIGSVGTSAGHSKDLTSQTLISSLSLVEQEPTAVTDSTAETEDIKGAEKKTTKSTVLDSSVNSTQASLSSEDASKDKHPAKDNTEPQASKDEPADQKIVLDTTKSAGNELQKDQEDQESKNNGVNDEKSAQTQAPEGQDAAKDDDVHELKEEFENVAL